MNEIVGFCGRCGGYVTQPTGAYGGVPPKTCQGCGTVFEGRPIFMPRSFGQMAEVGGGGGEMSTNFVQRGSN